MDACRGATACLHNLLYSLSLSLSLSLCFSLGPEHQLAGVLKPGHSGFLEGLGAPRLRLASANSCARTGGAPVSAGRLLGAKQSQDKAAFQSTRLPKIKNRSQLMANERARGERVSKRRTGRTLLASPPSSPSITLVLSLRPTTFRPLCRDSDTPEPSLLGFCTSRRSQDPRLHHSILLQKVNADWWPCVPDRKRKTKPNQ